MNEQRETLDIRTGITAGDNGQLGSGLVVSDGDNGQIGTGNATGNSMGSGH